LKLRRRFLALALLFVAGCGQREPVETPRPTPAPRPGAPTPPAERPVTPPRRPAEVAAPVNGGPEIRIGLLVDVASTTVGGGSHLVVRPAGRGASIILPGGRSARLSEVSGGVQLEGADRSSRFTGTVLVEPADAGGFVRIGGKDYRGKVEIVRRAGGLVVVNVLSMESYLGGVVAAELGVQITDAAEAMKAQAVIARTYAVRQMGRHRRDGFDLLATVADQKYDGIGGETSAAWSAIAGTRGEVATYRGAPIDAFFHSTCGGRTAAGSEVFTYADRDYLRSVNDRDPSGEAWCKASPRSRWEQEWNSTALARALERGLRLTPAEAQTVRDVEVTGRGPSGRATRLRVRLRGREVVVDGSNAVRRALPPPDLDLLRSAAFTLTYRADGERLGTLIVDGEGSGHGVGLCQWGAIGRARAGHRYTAILSAYYPGTGLERRW
jgi:stage II sporulation protein D